ncbi:MAG TPA: Phenylacetic acid catabolic protein, partial [Longimicrobiales bacterium]|nr:Phenylacetic acid catabolic protein [Longimicrobiales bacterium]
GHARLLYAMLKDFGEDPRPVEHERPAAAYASVDVLDGPLEDWARLVAAMMVVDTALTAALEGFAAGSYEPARARIPKMVSEEAFHRDLALAWFRRIAGGGSEGRERLAAAVGDLLPRTLAWLDPDDTPFRSLAEAGLVEPGRTLMHRYRERLGGTLGLVGVEVAGTAAQREGWDEDRGRGPGHPAEEAVERARGDRNRALFVE